MDWKQIDFIHTGYGADNYLAVEAWGLIFYCYVNGKYVGSAGISTPDVLTFGPVVDFAPITAGF
jgi:hypothetical protein